MTDETLSIDLTIATDDPLSPRLVVTLCGDVGQGESMTNPKKYFHNNLVNALKLADAASATALALALVSLAACDRVSALLFKRTADDATLLTTLATRPLKSRILSSR